MKDISDCFEDLSHALRVLQEADHKAHTQKLILLDVREAVWNIETAYAATLNSVHSLCDAAIGARIVSNYVLYNTVEISALLALRNARHHNHARKIRTIYRFHLDDSPESTMTYDLINYPVHPENSEGFEVYISAYDLLELLNLPEAKTRIRVAKSLELKIYLGISTFSPEIARRQFLNFISILINGCVEIHKLIGAHITPTSVEAKLFHFLFDNMPKTDLKTHLHQELILPPLK